MGMAGQTLSPEVTAPAPRRITVDEFERMIAANVWPEDERIELIKGELIAMPPINARHAYAVDVLTQAFIRQLAGRVWVSGQNPVRLETGTRPQPDGMLLRPPANRYRAQLPEPADVLLVVEVSDTTLAYDRDVKMPLYAQAGLPEMWLVDLPGERLSVYRHPEAGTYTQLTTYKRGAEVAPEAFPEAVVSVSEVLGEAG